MDHSSDTRPADGSLEGLREEMVASGSWCSSSLSESWRTSRRARPPRLTSSPKWRRSSSGLEGKGVTTVADHVAQCLDELHWLLITVRHDETPARREEALEAVLERIDYVARVRSLRQPSSWPGFGRST